jgi:hypothetical protein
MLQRPHAGREQTKNRTERIAELTQQVANLGQEQNPDDEARASVQLRSVKAKNDWYATTLKEKEQAVNGMNNGLVEAAIENDELTAERDALKEERDTLEEQVRLAAEDAVRGRLMWRGQGREASLSPWSKAHNLDGTLKVVSNSMLLPPPLLPNARLRSKSRSRSGAVHRHLREGTADSGLSIASNASINLDSTLTMPIKTDRSVESPTKFDGNIGTFYQWLTALTLKLSVCQFRSEEDGLRYVQGFMTGTPWNLVAPRVPTLGGWGKPCPNPFATVDDMMQLLKERYGEDNTEERAMTAMVTLRQTEKQDFNLFYATYQEYQAYCPMSTDKQEIHRLQGKLNSRFRNKLADGMDVSSLKELVARCIRLQSQWESIDAEAPASRQPRSQSKNRGRRGKADDAPAGTVGGNTNAKTGLSIYRVTLPDSELPSEYRNMPPLTSEVRQALRDAGGCYKCRKKGHTGQQREKCPLAILEDAYEKRTSKVNQVQVEDVPEHSGNGMAAR